MFKTLTQMPGALCMLSRLPEVQGGVGLLQGHHEVPGGDGEGARRGGVFSNGKRGKRENESKLPVTSVDWACAPWKTFLPMILTLAFP